jgi:hypothetical protein
MLLESFKIPSLLFGGSLRWGRDDHEAFFAGKFEYLERSFCAALCIITVKASQKLFSYKAGIPVVTSLNN